MSEMKHTPEPWFMTEPMHGHATEYKCVQIGPDAMYSTLELKPEDARRIVAAVNAVAGISTEALESGVVAEMRAALEWYADIRNHSRRLDESNPAPPIDDDSGSRAREVIAKAKGETP